MPGPLRLDISPSPEMQEWLEKATAIVAKIPETRPASAPTPQPDRILVLIQAHPSRKSINPTTADNIVVTAEKLCEDFASCPERTVALRRMLEAMDQLTRMQMRPINTKPLPESKL